MPVRNLFNVVGRVLQGVRSVVLGAPKTQPADDASPLPALSATPACPLPASGGDAPKKRVSTDDVPDEDRVSSCMSKPVVSLDAEKTVAQAQTLMAKHNVSSILITCELCQPGIVTRSDIETKVLAANESPGSITCGEIMSCPVLSISAKASVWQCAYLLDALAVRRLMVTQGGQNRYKMVGVVSYSDLLSRWHGGGQEEALLEGAHSVAELAEREELAEAELAQVQGLGGLPVSPAASHLASMSDAAHSNLSSRQSSYQSQTHTSGGSSAGYQMAVGAGGGTDGGPQGTLSRLNSFSGSIEVSADEIEVVGRIGRGGFGEVLRGRWKGTEVALKKLWLDEAGALDVKAFEREASVLASLRHPNVVLFMGVCLTSPDDVCLVMEYCPRGSLDRLLHSSKVALSTRQRLRLAVQAARGMCFLHEHDPPIIHRDLKPGNLLVTADMSIKVCDFGLSRRLHGAKGHVSALSSRNAVGTPHYAAPECLRNEAFDKTADAWSFGMVLWEILERRRPFSHMDAVQVAAAIAFAEEPPKLALGEGFDPRLQQLIDRCVSLDKEKRPTFREMLDTLGAVYEATPQDARRGGSVGGSAGSSDGAPAATGDGSAAGAQSQGYAELKVPRRGSGTSPPATLTARAPLTPKK